MKSIVKEENLREDIRAYFDQYEITHLNPEDVAAKLFQYAHECKRGKKFNDTDSFELVSSIADDPVIAKELWAILTVYCFENLAYQLIGQHLQGKSSYEAVDDMFISCCSTITICARSYSFESKNEFATYVHAALQNNLRHEQRMGLALPIPRHFRIEAAIMTEEMMSNPNVSVEDLAKKARTSIKTATALERALRNRDTIPFSAPVDGSPNGDSLGKFLESDENIERDYTDRELDRILETKLFPTIADIFGNESAYIVRVRTRSVWGEKKIGFRAMEPGFCRYLTAVKNLHVLSTQCPQFEELCTTVERIYATEGLSSIKAYLDSCSNAESEMIKALLEYSKTEADGIIENERETNDCFIGEFDIRKKFTKIFPTNGTKMNKRDLGKCRRFRHELRALGLEKLANAMAQNAGSFVVSEAAEA